MTKQIDSLIKDTEKKIENKAFTNKDLKDLVNGVYNFDEILLKTDFELEKTIERLEANQVVRAEFYEKVVDDENVRQLRIFFHIPFLDVTYPIETGLIINEAKNDVTLNFFNRNISFEETLEFMRTPERIEIEDLEIKLNRIIDVIASNHEVHGGGIRGWFPDDVLEYADIEKSVKHNILAQSVIRKLEKLELKHGADDAIFIMSSSLNELIVPDTAKGFEIFIHSVDESEKEINAEKIKEEKNSKISKSLKM
ncbi:hypothetical protein OX90_11265 [Pseudomonas coronafaciens pv. porri]|uniref:Uncharacterized protein n=1 Tax=Pseudomonas coronafaciens pv. porri TaxID=83964 RepID=A0ABR5JPQ9_9PSED|nr:hypothetical protein [Pseudomonas coronafaciens]KOP59454.1 hypothetical protein OX90_11265 [Pseudomonas coronafaciens pv. porri]